MELACAKLVLIDELLADEALCCSAVDECRHRRAFHSGMIGQGDTQGVFVGEKHIVGE